MPRSRSALVVVLVAVAAGLLVAAALLPRPWSLVAGVPGFVLAVVAGGVLVFPEVRRAWRWWRNRRSKP